jgi:hypothetical protein
MVAVYLLESRWPSRRGASGARAADAGLHGALLPGAAGQIRPPAGSGASGWPRAGLLPGTNSAVPKADEHHQGDASDDPTAFPYVPIPTTEAKQ